MNALPTIKPLTIKCPRCGKANKRDEVLCTACGTLLKPEQSRSSTRTLTPSEADNKAFSLEHFDQSSTLSLHVRGAVDASLNDTYAIRPQDSSHEIVIGRASASNTAVVPDIDLTPHRAEQRGVSRMHLSLRYNAKHNNITVMDMNSANGSFINGQRLHPNEVRILRDGDELRLGKLVLEVTFYHVIGFQEGDFR